MNRMIRVQKQVLAGIICLVLAGSPVFLLSANGAEIITPELERTL